MQECSYRHVTTDDGDGGREGVPIYRSIHLSMLVQVGPADGHGAINFHLKQISQLSASAHTCSNRDGECSDQRLLGQVVAEDSTHLNILKS